MLATGTKSFSLAFALAGAAFFTSAAPARANLVLNGDFENSTPIDIITWPTSAGGIGQVGNIVNLPDWTKTPLVADGSDGYVFVVNQDADNYINAWSPYPNQGGGFPSKFSNAASSNIFLWGPDYGPNPQSNGFSGPPGSAASNKFIGADGDFGASILSQVVTGFTPGSEYVLSFQYAGSQETGEQGDTTQQWKVRLGGQDFSTPTWTNPSRGFTPWATYTSSPFIASSSSLNLEFEGFGRAVASGSLPPFLLLDNVQIVENAPPAPAPVPGPLPALGAGMALAWSRKLRHRIGAVARNSRD